MQNLIKRLEKRGWKNKEIAKAGSIVENANVHKTKENLFLEKRVFWILLAVIIVGNFAISVALVPLLLALKGIALYFLIIVLGISFGMLYELVIRTIEHLEKRHHLFLAAMIPLVALGSAFLISREANELVLKFKLNNIHEPAMIGLAYSVSFVLTYIIYRFVFGMEYYLKE